MSDTIQSFSQLPLSLGLQKALEQMGYKEPTPIQVQAIPSALSNRDLIASAQTGAGKTAAFCIPIIAKLEKNPRKSALILVPTRETAAQISGVLTKLTQKVPDLNPTLLVDRAAMGPQTKMLSNKPRIIIATPSRLVDHLKRGTLSLFGTDILVLDEADTMIGLGFSAQLNEILRFLPSQRQTLMFSATLPPEAQRLAGKYLKDPVRVSLEPAVKKNSVLMTELTSRAGSVKERSQWKQFSKLLSGQSRNVVIS